MKHVLLSAAATFGALFPIVNPVAKVPIFLGLSEGCSPAERRALARRAALIVAAILLLALVGGRFILHFFGVSLEALEIAGGLVVGYTGWKMATATADDTAGPREGTDFVLTPLAIPLLAGPGAFGVVLGLSTRANVVHDYPGFVLGIVLIALLVGLLFGFGERLFARLSESGIDVLNRVFGLIVLAIAAEMVLHGVIGEELSYSQFHQR